MNYFDQSHFSFVPLISVKDGTLVKESYIEEGSTGLDESYPQHYGIQTAALDWTIDPSISLFFTIYSDKFYNNPENKYLVVNVFRELISEGSPVIIQEKSKLKDNPRAIAQKGTFTYFKNPCSYYMYNGYFPSIEKYELNFKNTGAPKFFHLEKFALERSQRNINDILNYLQGKKINEEALCLSKILAS